MGARRIFSRGGQWGVWRTEVPKRGPRAIAWWGSRGKAPISWRQFLKMKHKYSIYWGFRQHLQDKNHFTTFPGGKCPPCPCMPVPMESWCTTQIGNASDKTKRLQAPLIVYRLQDLETISLDTTPSKCMPPPLQYSVCSWPWPLTFDLWPWKLFRQFSLAW